MQAKESTRDKIVEISAEIIAQEGLRNFTAKNIAQRLGISDAAIFKHFKDMNDIVQAVIKKYTNECLSAITRIVFDESKTIRVKIDEIMDTHIEMLEKSRGVVPLLCFELSRDQNYDNRALINFLESYHDLISVLIYRGIEEGIIKKDLNVEEIVFTFFGLLQSRVFIWFLRDKKGSIIQDIKTLKILFEEGIFNNATQ